MVKDKAVTVSLTERDYLIIQEYAKEREWSMSKALGKLVEKNLESMRESYEQRK